MTPGRLSPSANPLVAFLDRKAAERGWSRERLSQEAGLSRDAIRSIENRGPRAGANMGTIQKYARALEIDVAELVAVLPSNAEAPPRPVRAPAGKANGDVAPAGAILPPVNLVKDVPVKGTTAGSAVGAFQLTTDVIEYVGRPPALMTTRDAYALYVENESMVPRFWPGELVFVHPHRPLQVGDAMVVQIQAHPAAEIESYIKIFKGRTAEWIVAEQYNPRSEVRYARATVIATHKVLTSNELFGV
jgi:phage repressor protein C with HTH and peptisase S24 domain